MNNLNVVIGIEIHVVVNTLTKMFSPSKNSHLDPANTNIHPIDLALPGTIPSVNKAVIIKALWLAQALKMKSIDCNVRFDRKNYFYQDLPKGFQITQYYFPIAKNGTIEIDDKNGKPKTIQIDHFHIEEDTAKQIKLNEQNILLDFNRAGSPLFEIVTAPVFSNALEVKSYLINLRRLLLAFNISDGRMEDGSMRVDINISVNPVGTKRFGQKVEIKNVNSVSNVVKAINFEIERQQKMCLSNHLIQQETRSFDEKEDCTVYMRNKSNALDYRYMTEPNIFCIRLSKEFVNATLANLPLTPQELRKNYQAANLNNDFIELLLDNPPYQKLLRCIDENVHDLKESARWLFVELFGLLNKKNLKWESLKQEVFNQLGLLIQHLQKQSINNKQAKHLLECLIENNGTKSVQALIDEYGYRQLCDENVLEAELVDLLDQYPDHLHDYHNRPERIEKFFIGLLMKKKSGAVNPQISVRILRRLLKDRVD